MKKEQKNTQVAVFLQGTLDNGEIFEKTPTDHPVIITLGQETFFPTIEKELFKMKPGETRTFNLTPEQAYGPCHKHLIQTIDRSVFGSRIDPQPGMILSLAIEGQHGPEKVPATVISATPEHVTVDYNHPLAGKNVTYEITLQNYIN